MMKNDRKFSRIIVALVLAFGTTAAALGDESTDKTEGIGMKTKVACKNEFDLKQKPDGAPDEKKTLGDETGKTTTDANGSAPVKKK